MRSKNGQLEIELSYHEEQELLSTLCTSAHGMLSPIYNTDGSISFKNNRLESTHLGISGALTREVSYRMLYTRSKSWGTYSNPARDVLTDTYLLWEMNYQPQRLKSWRFTASLGIDRGDMSGTNNGIFLSIRKTGHL